MRCASNYFHRLDKQRVAIGKACLYAVWPDQTSAHLRQKHELLRDEVRVVCDKGGDSETVRVQQRNRARSGVSASLTLPANSRGWAPLPAPASTLSDTSTRNHWRQTHQWSASDHRGHLGRIEAEEYRKRCADASSSVFCQRLFPAGESSGYFEVSLGDAGPSRAGADAERESTMKLASIVRGELAALEEEQHEGAHVFRGFESAKEVSLWARAPHAGRKISRDNASAMSPSLERLRLRRASRPCRRYATASSVWGKKPTSRRATIAQRVQSSAD
ncbi:hypothetical protein LTR74_017402 [Friedmanniomyces endolithicus]|nr:hypothetical protein LTR74_017402 [Friedmanniomyces endolithicus]